MSGTYAIDRKKLPAEIEAYLPHTAAVCFLALLIVGLTIHNDSWLYTQIGWLDPWSYVGFGYSYGHPRFDADNYKLARLPWILAEFYTRRFLNPVSSQYVLQLGSLLVQGCFFYFAIARLLGALPALIGAAFLLTLPFIHGAGGADYNTTLSGPLYCLSFYVLTVAASSNRMALPVLFGACFGLLLHTNFLYLNFLLPLSIHFGDLRRHALSSTRPPSIFIFGFFALVGLIAVTAALSVLNWSHGRQWLFFLSLAKIATTYVLDNSHQGFWWQPWSGGWYRQEPYIGVLAAGAIAAIALLLIACVKRGETNTSTRVASLASQYLSICAIWICWQTAGQTALQPSYFAYPLWVPLAGVVSCVVAFCPTPMRCTTAAVAAAIILVACILPYASLWPIKNVPVDFYSAMGVYLIIFGGAFLLDATSTRLGVYVLALLLGPANGWVNQDLTNYRAAACTDRRDAQLALIDAHNAIASLDPDFVQSAFIWRNPDDSDALSVSTCSLMPARFFGDSLAWSGWHYLDDARPLKPISEIGQDRLQWVIAHDPIIVMVTNDSNAAEQLRTRFAALGKTFGPTQQIQIKEGVISFYLQILR